MKSTTFHVPKMDCRNEERQVRGVLEPDPQVRELRFDLPGRALVVRHEGDPASVLARLEPWASALAW